MSGIVTCTDDLDLEIAIAAAALSGARGRFDRCPSPENQLRVDEAGAEVDRLLDERLVVSRMTVA
jgi:hypothetical protein